MTRSPFLPMTQGFSIKGGSLITSHNWRVNLMQRLYSNIYVTNIYYIDIYSKNKKSYSLRYFDEFFLCTVYVQIILYYIDTESCHGLSETPALLCIKHVLQYLNGTDFLVLCYIHTCIMYMHKLYKIMHAYIIANFGSYRITG